MLFLSSFLESFPALLDVFYISTMHQRCVVLRKLDVSKATEIFLTSLNKKNNSRILFVQKAFFPRSGVLHLKLVVSGYGLNHCYLLLVYSVIPHTTATCINVGYVFCIQIVDQWKAATWVWCGASCVVLLLYFWKESKGFKCSCRLACWQLYANGLPCLWLWNQSKSYSGQCWPQGCQFKECRQKI